MKERTKAPEHLADMFRCFYKLQITLGKTYLRIFINFRIIRKSISMDPKEKG